MQLADPPIGVLLVLAMSSIAVYGVMLAGWSSGSKYPLLGSVRASAQMISYEAALGLSLAAVLMTAGTLSTSGIVSAQSSITNWHLLSTGIVPFVVFLIAMTAELNRPPFDLVEAEQELVGGFHTEYSSIRLLVLPRRVHERHFDERAAGHPVPRWPAAADPVELTSLRFSDPLVEPHGCSSKSLPSSICMSGSVRRFHVCGTTN